MPRHISVINCFLHVMMGLVHDEYSLFLSKSILVRADFLIGAKRVYHDDGNCQPVVFRILSSVPRLCWRDMFLSPEKFLFILFSRYSLVVHAHRNWYVWHVFSVVILFVPPGCTASLFTRMIRYAQLRSFYAMSQSIPIALTISSGLILSSLDLS